MSPEGTHDNTHPEQEEENDFKPTFHCARLLHMDENPLTPHEELERSIEIVSQQVLGVRRLVAFVACVVIAVLLLLLLRA
jgi:hypothetical protein